MKRVDVTDVIDFKDPTNGLGNYSVCVYDSSGAAQPLREIKLLPGGPCGQRACWKTVSAGAKFADRDAKQSGFRKVKLRAGAQGAGFVSVRAKGARLQAPALPLTLPVTVQLLAADDVSTECWQTRFTSASRNDAQRFRATGP